MTLWTTLPAAAVVLLTGCQTDDPGPPPYAALAAVAVAEDKRSEVVEPALLAATSHQRAAVRTAAYRALGRHERPEWMDLIAEGLTDADPTVRGTAAIALGQAAFRSGQIDALGRIRAALPDERNTLVRGILAETGGRLASADDPSTGEAAEAVLLSVASDPGDPGGLGTNPAMLARPIEFLVRGFEHLARRTRGQYPKAQSARTALAELASFGRDGPGRPTGWAESGADLASARVRRTALSALAASGTLPLDILDEGLSDPDAGVRVVASALLSSLPDVDGRRALIERQLSDPYFLVRFHGLNAYDRWLRADLGCRALLTAAGDANAHVGVRALDLLGSDCPAEREQQQELLASSAGGVEDDPEWHRPVHAWVALARRVPSRARTLLSSVQGHPSPFARAYAAQGAVHLGDLAALHALAGDTDPNVRGAALSGLATMVDHEADELYVDALGSDDPGLVRTAATLLAGTPARAEVTDPLWSALERFDAGGRETERDARVALLERLAEVASASDANRLRPFLQSFDERLASDAAELLSRWTGRTESPGPRPDPAASALVPTAEDLARLSGAQVVLEMERGGSIRIRLSPLLAPTNALRFAQMAESGDLDGRTFHRVVPGFVIQGGSRYANEYAGEGPYTRDEIGLGAHWRGSVGISTRGRDTGDGQIFVNLIDNLRLDHGYTIFGQVLSGMEVVDGVLEGDPIRRATLELVSARPEGE